MLVMKYACVQPADQDWMKKTDTVASFQTTSVTTSSLAIQTKVNLPITGGKRYINTIFKNFSSNQPTLKQTTLRDVIQYIAAHDNLTPLLTSLPSLSKRPKAKNYAEIHRRLRLGTPCGLDSPR